MTTTATVRRSIRRVRRTVSKFSSRDGLTVREYVKQGGPGHTLSALAKASGVPYSVLHRHAVLGGGISVRNAKKLEQWSKGQISARRVLGI